MSWLALFVLLLALLFWCAVIKGLRGLLFRAFVVWRIPRARAAQYDQFDVLDEFADL
jgi:hypothetical protein